MKDKLIPLDATLAWLAEQVNAAWLQNQEMMLLASQYSEELDKERQRSARLQVELDAVEETNLLLRKKVMELQGRLDRVRKGLPEFDPDNPPERLPRSTGQLIEPGNMTRVG